MSKCTNSSAPLFIFGLFNIYILGFLWFGRRHSGPHHSPARNHQTNLIFSCCVEQIPGEERKLEHIVLSRWPRGTSIRLVESVRTTLLLFVLGQSSASESVLRHKNCTFSSEGFRLHEKYSYSSNVTSESRKVWKLKRRSTREHQQTSCPSPRMHQITQSVVSPFYPGCFGGDLWGLALTKQLKNEASVEVLKHFHSSKGRKKPKAHFPLHDGLKLIKDVASLSDRWVSQVFRPASAPPSDPVLN